MTAYRILPDKTEHSPVSFHVQILEGEFAFVQVVLSEFDFSTLDSSEYFSYDSQLLLIEDKEFSEDENRRLSEVIDEIVANIVNEAIRRCGEEVDAKN